MVVFHIDVNSAYLSWEAADRAEKNQGEDILSIPSAIGGDIATRHGIILAKSVPAKKLGIVTGEPVTNALKKCPKLLLIPPNHDLYKKKSDAFIKILKEYSPVVEQYSIDEAFIDMTGMEKLFGDPVTSANRIRERIYKELGFTVNIGVSSNKLLAKMASDFQKPNLVHTLFPEEIKTKMWNLSVGELFFVGKSTEKKLTTMGIHTIGELAATSKELLRSHFGKHGEVIWDFANGNSVSLLEDEPVANKGYGHGTTLPADLFQMRDIELVLLSLTEKVCQRIRRDGVKAQTVIVGMKDKDFRQSTHQRVLDTPTDITLEIYSLALELFQELWRGQSVRFLSVSVGKVSVAESNRQMSLFDTTDYEKLEKLDAAIDTIKERFGNGAIKRASILAMEEKKKREYEKNE